MMKPVMRYTKNGLGNSLRLLLFLLLACTKGQAQNPAYPAAGCQYQIGQFDHFESRTDGLRLFSKQPDGWEVFAVYDSAATLIYSDTTGRDTMSTINIVTDSLLVEHNYLGDVTGLKTVPDYFWNGAMPSQPGIPSVRVVNAALLDSFYYFVWLQAPLSASFPGKLWIEKTDRHFETIATTPALSTFFTFLGIEYFAPVAGDLIGCSFHTAAGQNSGTTDIFIIDKDLTQVVHEVNSGGTGSPPPGSGLKRLTDNCFAYQTIDVIYPGRATQYMVFQRANGQIRLLNSKWVKTGQLSTGPPLYHIQTVFKSWDETGLQITGESDKLLPVSPTSVTWDPAAMNYYAIDSLHITAPLAGSDTLSPLFTLYSFYWMYGVVHIGDRLWAITSLNGDGLVDITCANPTQDSTLSVVHDGLPLLKTTLFPNPASGIFYISTTTVCEKIDVFSADGRPLTDRIRIYNEGSHYRIDMTLLPKGVYFLHIQGEQNVADSWERVVLE